MKLKAVSVCCGIFNFSYVHLLKSAYFSERTGSHCAWYSLFISVSRQSSSILLRLFTDNHF